MSHVFSQAWRQTRHWVSWAASSQWACIAGSNVLDPVPNFCGSRKARHLSLAAVAPLPLHSVPQISRPPSVIRIPSEPTERIFHVGAPGSRAKYQHFHVFLSSHQLASTTANYSTNARRNVNVNTHQSSPFLLLLPLLFSSFSFHLSLFASRQHQPLTASRHHTAVVRPSF
jgi:hypothetical protein